MWLFARVQLSLYKMFQMIRLRVKVCPDRTNEPLLWYMPRLQMYGTKHSHRKLRKMLQLSLHEDSQSIIHLEKEEIIHG